VFVVKIENVQAALNEFGKLVIDRAKSNLKKGGKYGSHNTSNKLTNSLRFETKESARSIEFDFYAEDYWKFLDKGVKGKISSAKAPNSPYKFGSGTGKKGGLRTAIDSWVVRKGLAGTRGADGRFMSRKQMVSMISRSIYLKGTPETKFFREAFETTYKSLDENIVEKYGLDLESFLKFTLKEIK
jgi:hypothetical protein